MAEIDGDAGRTVVQSCVCRDDVPSRKESIEMTKRYSRCRVSERKEVVSKVQTQHRLIVGLEPEAVEGGSDVVSK